MDYYYHKGAKCSSCGEYVWTTENSYNVKCLCPSGAEIQNNVVVSGNEISDMNEFKQYVANTLNISINNLNLIEL